MKPILPPLLESLGRDTTTSGTFTGLVVDPRNIPYLTLCGVTRRPALAAPGAFVLAMPPGQVVRRTWYSYADSRLMVIRSPGRRP